MLIMSNMATKNDQTSKPTTIHKVRKNVSHKNPTTSSNRKDQIVVTRLRLGHPRTFYYEINA